MYDGLEKVAEPHHESRHLQLWPAIVCRIPTARMKAACIQFHSDLGPMSVATARAWVLMAASARLPAKSKPLGAITQLFSAWAAKTDTRLQTTSCTKRARRVVRPWALGPHGSFPNWVTTHDLKHVNGAGQIIGRHSPILIHFT